MKCLFRVVTLVLICVFVFTSLSGAGSSSFFFRLSDSQTGQPLANVNVSIYDGINICFGDCSTDMTQYHYADMKTSEDGIIILNLADFKDSYGHIFINSVDHSKHLTNRQGKINVPRYKPEGCCSLRIIAHHNYDMRKGLTTTKTFPDKKVSEPKEFKIIDVPMERKHAQADPSEEADKIK